MSTIRPDDSTENALRTVKKFIPRSVFGALQPLYHRALSVVGPLLYRYPSRKLVVIAVTGTKGKSTTVELTAAMLRGAGHKVASMSTIRFCIGEKCEPNLYKMTVPGRFAVQKFLRAAVDAGCTHAVIEMTSEGAKQFRHKGIDFDALVFTNLQREHIESHGSFENYAAAKLSLAKHLEDSPKRPRIIVANQDDTYGKEFLAAKVEVKTSFSLKDAEPYSTDDKTVRFVWKRQSGGGQLITVPLPGIFNLYNILAVMSLGEAMGVDVATMQRALEHIGPIAGRAERVEQGQPFAVVVDYAHTPDSLRALFEAFKGRRIISVIGSTGGGRDTWNRPEKGKIADEYCDTTIITNEDPYDEDPMKIVSEIAKGFSTHKPNIILDRRAAIHWALDEAREGDAVLITGKGTDPYIMEADGHKTPWSDRKVASEELQKLQYH